jgi:general stress protein CsbA
MKNLLIIVFCRIDYNKIEKKGNVQKTFTITLFDFATFGHCILLFTSATFGRHVALLVFTTFGCSGCGKPPSKFLKLEERKR